MADLGRKAEDESQWISDRMMSIPQDVKMWRTEIVQQWLSNHIQLPQYLPQFQEASVDGLLLLELADKSLLEVRTSRPPINPQTNYLAGIINL
ncbi:unnamed protein product, partial [Choristocarpus tenellus]